MDSISSVYISKLELVTDIMKIKFDYTHNDVYKFSV